MFTFTNCDAKISRINKNSKQVTVELICSMLRISFQIPELISRILWRILNSRVHSFCVSDTRFVFFSLLWNSLWNVLCKPNCSRSYKIFLKFVILLIFTNHDFITCLNYGFNINLWIKNVIINYLNSTQCHSDFNLAMIISIILISKNSAEKSIFIIEDC